MLHPHDLEASVCKASCVALLVPVVITFEDDGGMRDQGVGTGQCSLMEHADFESQF